MKINYFVEGKVKYRASIKKLAEGVSTFEEKSQKAGSNVILASI